MSADFRQIFQLHFDYVARTLRLLGVGPNDLEDVTHDVFLHVFRHLGDYDPARPIKPWLYGFAFRLARDFRQLVRHRETMTADFSSSLDERSAADTLVSLRERQRLALRCLEALDDDEREVFVATVLEELTAPQAAEMLCIPLNTLYSRLRRARTKFEQRAARLSGKGEVR